jgi:hypothetical protein
MRLAHGRSIVTYGLALALVALTSVSALALEPYDTPVVECAGSTLASITLSVCGGATTGAPAGLSIHWKKLSDYEVSGWADDGTLCALSLSGQPSLQHPDKSRWELLAGECEEITIGDINFDETGVSGQGCGLEPLDCGTEYVFRWFAHAGRRMGRSDWGSNIICSTASCPSLRCAYTQGYWKNHGGPAGCNGSPVNDPDPVWPASVMSGGMTLGTVTYTADQLCTILNAPAAGSKAIALAHQMIAARLNLANDATDCTNVQDALVAADAVIGSFDLFAKATTSCSGPPPRAPICSQDRDGGTLTGTITSYNEGALCTGNCHGSDGAANPLTQTFTPEEEANTWGGLKALFR